MNVCLLLSRILGSKKGPSTFTLSGTITGDEVEGVTITLTGDASDSTTSAADGTYSFAGLSNGDYNVEPSLEGYIFDPTDIDVTIANADDVDNDFVSSGVYTISGTIVDGAAAGIEGVTVALTGDATDSTTTAADGTYSFTGVVDGSYTVTPTKTDYAFAPESASVTVSGADDTGNDFVGTALLSLPLTIGWGLGDSPPASGAAEAWNTDNYENGVTVVSPITKFTYTPSDFTGSLRLSTLTNTSAYSTYRGFAKNGQSFDMSQGLRAMALVTLEAVDAYTGKFKAAVWGLHVYNDSAGFPVDGVSGYGFGKHNWVSDPSAADQYYCDQWLNGTKTTLVSAAAWTGNIDDGAFPYMALGIEIGANFSGLKMRIRSFGSPPGSGHSSGETKDLPNPSGDWSGVTLDAIRITIGYTQLSGTDHTDQIHWLWIGTASDDWPV